MLVEVLAPDVASGLSIAVVSDAQQESAPSRAWKVGALAELTGLTVRERAHLLVDIAHPDFRAALRQVADAIGRA